MTAVVEELYDCEKYAYTSFSLERRDGSPQLPLVDIVWVTDGSQEVDDFSDIPESLDTLTTHYICRCDEATDDVGSRILDQLASHREQSHSSTRPLLWITNSRTRWMVDRALNRARHESTSKRDRYTPIADCTHSVLSISPPRRWQFLQTLFLAAGQFACYTVLKQYELCHGNSAKKCSKSMIMEDLRQRVSGDVGSNSRERNLSFGRLPSWMSGGILHPLLESWQNPSTLFFIFAVLGYGAMAAMQYHINRADKIQPVYLILAIAGVIWTCRDFLADPTKPSSIVSSFAVICTAGMTGGAGGRWLVRTLVNMRKIEHEVAILKLVTEALEMEVDSHIIQYHNIE